MYKKIEYLVLAALIFFALISIFQLGAGWDAIYQYDLGKDRLDYLFSFGANGVNQQAAATKLYPGAYSTILAFFVEFFPRTFTTQGIHLTNFAFSFLTIIAISKLTKIFFNKIISKITFIICFFNPIFFGQMSLSGLDISVAFSFIWIIYFSLQYLRKQSAAKTNKYIYVLGLLLGLGVGTRIGFLAILFPFFLFLLFELFFFKIFINNRFNYKKFYIDIIKVIIISYFFVVFFWVETHENIFTLPIKYAFESFNFGWGPPFILFNEQILKTGELPSTYILVNLFYKMPEYYIYGILLIFVLFLRIAKNFKSQFKGFIFKFTFIVAIIIFPNFLLIFSPYAVYDGLRLFLYIIPFISVLLALLIFFLYKNKKFLIYKILFYSLILTKIFFLVSFMQLTPYQYVYLNYFSQHVADNTKQFENDYWGTSTKKLIKKIKNNDSLNAENLKIAFCGLSEDEQIKNIKLFTNLKLKFVDKNSEYDFIIMNNRAVWDDLSDNKKTCFEKFKGTDIETISRRGLILSKLTKKYN
jgi:hypothetical protein